MFTAVNVNFKLPHEILCLYVCVHFADVLMFCHGAPALRCRCGRDSGGGWAREDQPQAGCLSHPWDWGWQEMVAGWWKAKEAEAGLLQY